MEGAYLTNVTKERIESALSTNTSSKPAYVHDARKSAFIPVTYFAGATTLFIVVTYLHIELSNKIGVSPLNGLGNFYAGILSFSNLAVVFTAFALHMKKFEFCNDHLRVLSGVRRKLKTEFLYTDLEVGELKHQPRPKFLLTAKDGAREQEPLWTIIDKKSHGSGLNLYDWLFGAGVSRMPFEKEQRVRMHGFRWKTWSTVGMLATIAVFLVGSALIGFYAGFPGNQLPQIILGALLMVGGQTGCWFLVSRITNELPS